MNVCQSLQPEQIQQFNISGKIAEQLCQTINRIIAEHSPEDAWKSISQEILKPSHPFGLHQLVFSHCYPDWHTHPESAPAWIPDAKSIQTTHIAEWMSDLNIKQLTDFHAWTVNHYADFLQTLTQKLHIAFQKPAENICDFSQGIESPQWYKNAKMNIAESCFNAKENKTAIIYSDDKNALHTMSYSELDQLSNRVANGLIQHGFTQNDAIAIDMPMTKEAVAIYLGIIKIGAIVVSIADSFSPEEIATRLRIANAKAIFTQDTQLRGEKLLPLYEKVTAARAPIAIVIPCQETMSCSLRHGDLSWETFLSENKSFSAIACDPMSICNILFSSGTTGDPKAIPWNHTTAIKAAGDAYLHQDIQENDIIAWPTNLGWMMGPWLIFAALINRATLALYHDAPRDKAFGTFVQNAKVTILGVVPTLVSSWRQSKCMEGLNWSSIKTFTSTGECSNPEDMLYLMSLAGYKPVIEYCGGTEIGGSYITSTLAEKNYPSLFTTPAMGLDLILLDEFGKPSNSGEVALIPPSIGLSTQLLNANHHDVYYANMPTVNGKILRRHGDQAQRLPNHCYSVLGRVDDTMNLGGIKVSSAEIERVISSNDTITETAAIAVSPPQNGPSQLVIYAATQKTLDKATIKQEMQAKINLSLNPLFKIHDVVFINELPKTASNKIMRRVLRQQYLGMKT